jgi:hypothetical protein
MRNAASLVFSIALFSLTSLACSGIPTVASKSAVCGRLAKPTGYPMRLRGGSGITLKTVTCPDKTLALTNKIYLHDSDLRRLIPEGEGYVTTRECIFLASTCSGIPPGSVALNSCQRRSLQISADEDLFIEKTKEDPTITMHVSIVG